MIIALVAALGAAIVDPDVLARTAARAAASDQRFEVVAEVEIADALDFEASRQACNGASAESCAVQMAGALDARYVLFLRLGSSGERTTLTLTLTDVATATVVGRSAVDDRNDLDAALAPAVTALLAPLPPEHSRLLISRVEGTAVVDSGPHLALVGGGVALGVLGLGGVVVGVLGALDARTVLNTPETSGDSKERADTQLLVSAVALAGGAVLALGGTGLLVWGLAE